MLLTRRSKVILNRDVGRRRLAFIRPSRLVLGASAVLLATSFTASVLAADDYEGDGYAEGTSWKSTGRLDQFTTYENSTGAVGVYLPNGPVSTKDHPFFRPLGKTGRSCATCHEPADAMGLSTETAQKLWQSSSGKDPLFAMVDGANCPDLPANERASHSLLLDRGLIRVALPWPPRIKTGKPIEPEFSIEVMRDPTGCNSSSLYGLASKAPKVSVFRKPRITANLRYVVNLPNDRRYLINVKTGYALPLDPDSRSGSLSMNIMSDARLPVLKDQFADAVETHLPGAKKLSSEEMDQLQEFVLNSYAAQVRDSAAGDLIEKGGPSGLGPFNLAIGESGLGGEHLDTPVFQKFDQWKATGDNADPSSEAAFRASVARGADLFVGRTFFVRDVNHINSIGLGNPIKRSCALCHNAQMTGHDGAPGWMDIGIATWPWANNEKDLPLFRLTCRKDVPPHPYLGRTIYTTDPGRALITGRCSDIGSLTMQQLRGLAARAPYFNNGSARTLREVIDFYDRRFNIGYTEQEKQDLVNFLRVL